ncbi:lytic transglycosylase domain-containing protein [Ruegeria sediminis]|uniref:Lytic transglycosylase domain-containing protein n=1 Tax=Ruegeria sediminis TaxID=2583820 RepID=A0ABY2WWF7_9RHOB|nr:transglycosylase SLT domain-containing protein [Ruegeria sediminis]TMV07092.1 lytic transglycosylase domain-containing protein [Ruegeria sediminis]
MPKPTTTKPLVSPLAALLLPVWLILAAPALSDTRAGEICDAAARRAARSEGVPLDVLRAITRVETGRMVNGRRVPWPWAVNLEGKGFWFDNEAEAKAYVSKVFKAGARSFDIGCFQINYRWHGQGFRSIDAMFDPNQNAAYAARFLRELHAEFGSWTAAAGAYHSRTAALAAAYSQRLEATLAALDGGPGHRVDAVAREANTVSNQPLFSGSGTYGPAVLGSLVPVSGERTAFIVFK